MQALKEDMPNEDITTNAIIKEPVMGEVKLICKQSGIIAGLGIFERVFTLLDENSVFKCNIKDGDKVEYGQVLGSVTADIKVLLSGERTALNFLQRMSGIATYTREMVCLLENTGIKLVDTRKTTPGMRIFEKYAVTVGGGYNHRFNLSDGILLKDNHISAAGGIAKAVQMAKNYASFVRKIEVEVENLDMVKEAVNARADIIMLDNMTPEMMKEAVKLIGGRAETECSGNVTKESIELLRDVGIDYISSGALTHSSPILDLSLKELHRI
ncbi:MAG: carboxylating nicotinate-nucleotide diphosphorylase [Bacillota bacterium]|nr:carboxylating nicotinate-nucleotide diphosphorylase [Bacillota bacterium]